MRLNKIIIILNLLLCFPFPSNAEPMRFTQYYAIETNVNNDKELSKVIERVHEYLKNNEIEHTGFFNKTTTLIKFIRVDAKIKNGENILIDTIKKDSNGKYTAKACVYNIKDGNLGADLAAYPNKITLSCTGRIWLTPGNFVIPSNLTLDDVLKKF